MVKPLTQIKLPTDRVNQLREVARGMGENTTLSAALGGIFKMYREQGMLSHGIPSVQINSLADGLAIKFDEGQTVGFSFTDAQRLATEIRNCLAGANEGQKIIHMLSDHAGSFMVHGHGNAIGVSLPMSVPPKMFSRDLALELADLVEYEISKAQT